ncbi:MAG: sodium-dependent transporter [Puniceicoccaceae bacterium]
MIADRWNHRTGAILAVAGSAVGLGNFLRFPGKVAEYGGGAFMLAYFISFLIIGLPICWAEWTMGRQAGKSGFHSAPGIFNILTRRPEFKYLGVIGVVVPIGIYMYYVYVEAWCLGYAVNFLKGSMDFGSAGDSKDFWFSFVGMTENGAGMRFEPGAVGFFVVICFLLNFYLVRRGVAKGIEWFCRIAMPLLIVLAVIVLIRVLTLGTPDPNQPQLNVQNGLGYMWNPTKIKIQVLDEGAEGGPQFFDKEEFVGSFEQATAHVATLGGGEFRVVKVTVWEQLARPELWLAAAGQIFFSLSVGFGVILTYASYLKERDDVVLGGLTASSANEFCEVGLGGMMTLPAGFAFLGAAGLAGMGTFSLGFIALPMVFANMWGGAIFGFLFFSLLFLAAVTSSLSMLQPGIAFLQSAAGMSKDRAVTLIAIITGLGTAFVMWFSAGAKALDSMDFWLGNMLIFVLATLQIIIFAWVVGIEKGLEEANRGSIIRIPRIFGFLMKYVTPIFLISVFILWLVYEVFGLVGSRETSDYVIDLVVEPNLVAWLSLMIIISLALFFGAVVHRSERYRLAILDEVSINGGREK